jgi:hypothetical protein
MNRWRRRLDELQRAEGTRSSAVPRTVQNAQNVQNPLATPIFEHFEQIEHRPETAVATPVPVAPASWSEDDEERAAIVEHDGGIPRAWAEGYARLHPDRPPADVPAKRWQRFINDVGLFLDGPFCLFAAALGWGPLDLFGADRERPFARIDNAGLLWLLNGDKLIALSENTATIETRTGARQTFRRRLLAVGDVVLAWGSQSDDGR